MNENFDGPLRYTERDLAIRLDQAYEQFHDRSRVIQIIQRKGAYDLNLQILDVLDTREGLIVFVS